MLKLSQIWLKEPLKFGSCIFDLPLYFLNTFFPLAQQDILRLSSIVSLLESAIFMNSFSFFKKNYFNLFLNILLKYSWFTMLISSVQQNMWFSYTYMYSFSHSFFYGLSQDIEYSSLCYIVGPCCLSILYITACICPLASFDILTTTSRLWGREIYDI